MFSNINFLSSQKEKVTEKMDSDFVIPLNKEDLLSNRAVDGYGVRKINEPSKLGEKLEGILFRIFNRKQRKNFYVTLKNHAMWLLSMRLVLVFAIPF